MWGLSLDSALWLAGILGELILLGILLKRRAYRTFPVFTVWVSVTILLEPVFYLLANHLSQGTYLKVFFSLSFPQFLLELAVLVEIAINVFKPVNRSLPNGILIFFAVAADDAKYQD